MAFVFETQRWKQSLPAQQPGPGYYHSSISSKAKGGVITPQVVSTQQQKYRKQQIVNEENMQVSRSLEKNKRCHYQSSKKLFQRAISAKVFKTKKEINQNSQLFKPINDNIGLNIGYPNNEKRSFENSIVRASLKKPKQILQIEPQTSSNNKPFNDKNFRTVDSNTPSATILKEQNIQFFNNCLTKQSSPVSNVNLTKFYSSQQQQKSQNFFSIVNQLKPPSAEKQNFLIASGNCKKTTIKPSSIQATPLRDSSQFEKNGSFDETTGIEDSIDNSFQYIIDATPGPGEYELRKDQPFLKSKVEKFGITQKRFKEPKRHEKILNLNVNVPTFKKSSKASQEKVAFGKNRPQTAKQTTNDFLLYDDHQTIQNKCIRNLIKDRQAPGMFYSKCDRFKPMKKHTYFGPDFFEKDKEKPITLPNSIFMSKVQRHQRPLSPTADIDFEGQDVMTIEKKLQKVNERKQLFESQIPGFYVSEPRFKYKTKEENNQPLKKVSTNDFNKKKQLKSFTFRKEQIKEKELSTEIPSPWTYSTGMKWIKPSHHVRFKF